VVDWCMFWWVDSWVAVNVFGVCVYYTYESVCSLIGFSWVLTHKFVGVGVINCYKVLNINFRFWLVGRGVLRFWEG